MRTKSVFMIGLLVASACARQEDWHLISISQDGPAMAAILCNPTMIKAYESGIPGNGKPFPDGSKMTKIHWVPTKMSTFHPATVPGRQPSPGERRQVRIRLPHHCEEPRLRLYRLRAQMRVL